MKPLGWVLMADWSLFLALLVAQVLASCVREMGIPVGIRYVHTSFAIS